LFHAIAVKHQNRRLVAGVFVVLLFFFALCREDGALVAQMNRLRRLIEDRGVADALHRRRFAAGYTILFHTAPHGLLLTVFAPRMPAILDALKQSQSAHRANRALRAHHPGSTTGERKTRR